MEYASSHSLAYISPPISIAGNLHNAVNYITNDLHVIAVSLADTLFTHLPKFGY